MINKTEIKNRFQRSAGSYEEHALVQKLIAGYLGKLIQKYVISDSQRILEIGCGTGIVTRQLRALFPDSLLFINDLVEEMCYKTQSRCSLPLSHCIPGDIETLRLNQTFDLITSASTVQWFQQPAATFGHLCQHLSPKGWLIFSTFGRKNFQEIDRITGNGLTYPSVEQISSWLNGEAEILYCEENLHTLYFSDPLEVLRHIKCTGVNATGRAEIWTKGRLKQFKESYRTLFAPNGQYPLTYHPLYFVCRKN